LDLVRGISRRSELIKSAVAACIIAICLLAMLSAPSMGVRGPSPLSVGNQPALIIIILGFAIGCYGTIVGIGGGPLIMPILILIYGWETEFLVATSLFIVFLNAFSGSLGYARQGRIDYKGGVKFALAALPGAVISSFIHHIFDIPVFDIIFGIFLILLSVYSFLSVNKVDSAQRRNKPVKRQGYRRVSFIDIFGQEFDFYANDKLGIRMNLLLGFFVGFLGIGGGVFQVPILAFLLYYPVHIATATSHFITMLICLFALIPHILLGNVYFAQAIWMGLGVVTGAQVGARLAPGINSKRIIYLFAAVLLLFAVKLLI
jgi:uncharacterized membrane protein YfcA